MSTLATADLGSSDEADQDFIPAPASPKRRSRKRTRSGSASSSSTSSNSGTSERREMKAEEVERKAEERRRRAAKAFAALRQEDPVGLGGKQENEVKMVEVERARRYAGETL